MTKICYRHECLKKGDCGQKIYRGYLPLCRLDATDCPFRAQNPYGRYEPEDVLLP